MLTYSEFALLWGNLTSVKYLQIVFENVQYRASFKHNTSTNSIGKISEESLIFQYAYCVNLYRDTVLIN